MSKYIKLSTKVQSLKFTDSWKCLTEQEKNYAYFLSKSSWAGAKMVLHQICYEAPLIFCLLQLYFKNNNYESLKHSAMEKQVTQDEWQKFIAYSAGFYANLSNYQSFGHNKFIPELSEESFTNILKSNPTQDPEYNKYLEKLYNPIKTEIFAGESPYNQLNFPHKGGVTGYFGRNLDEEDLALVKKYMKHQNIDPLNTRAFKTGDNEYLITIGSIQKSEETQEFNGSKFTVRKGEFSEYLQEVVMNLEKCLEFCGNENQKEMIEKYISHYQSGSIDIHKESQVSWIKDKSPVVESNQGWIEVYIDPENIRGYFEGWVAIVDKPKSEKFQKLVEISEEVIPLLPWPQIMEKEHFLAPDFTTLEVINFSTNGCPLGINIPNYDDIRETIGFKNVYLGNAMPQISKDSIQFATEEQSDMLCNLGAQSYVVHVACHELLGHGVGRSLFRNEVTGEDLEFTDPLTGQSFRSCYEKGEQWNEKFGSISTSYEECRADTCGFYLAVLPQIYSLFNIQDHQMPDMLWCSVMSQLRKGILGLTLYNHQTAKWGQAHTQGAFVFTQFIYQNQKTDIVSFEVQENNFYIHLNKENLMKEGLDLIRLLLVTLQTYKSSGAVERAVDFYNKYSQVDQFFLNIRNIVIDKKQPRRLTLNNNLVYYSQSQIHVQEYPECHEAIINSYIDRYGASYQMIDQIYNEWSITQNQLKVLV